MLRPLAIMSSRRRPTARVANNVPLSASAEFNPVLTRHSVLGRLMETWERIFVLCYGETCAAHTPKGSPDGRHMWWPAVQRRVVVFDAAELDRKNLPILKWAGCDIPNRPAGRSGKRAVAEPCTTSSHNGGSDWRLTAKHRLAALLAHLTLVATAETMNLTNVMIVEADLVPTLFVKKVSDNATHALRVAQRVKHALAVHPWSVVRLSGMFYSQEFAPNVNGIRSCSAQCQCHKWIGSELVKAMAPNLHLCEIPATPRAYDRIMPMLSTLNSWCDVRDTAAYAVHRSAFGAFTGYLDRLRALPLWLQHGALDVPAIDNWLPHAVRCLYVLPTLVTQPFTANDSQGTTSIMRQRSAHNFQHFCVSTMKSAGKRGSKSVTPRRPMKLASFATRHLYVMNDRTVARLSA